MLPHSPMEQVLPGSKAFTASAAKTATADKSHRIEKTPFFNHLESPRILEKRASDLHIRKSRSPPNGFDFQQDNTITLFDATTSNGNNGDQGSVNDSFDRPLHHMNTGNGVGGGFLIRKKQETSPQKEVDTPKMGQTRAQEDPKKKSSIELDKDKIKIKASKAQGSSPFRINKNQLYEQSSIIHQNQEHMLHIDIGSDGSSNGQHPLMRKSPKLGMTLRVSPEPFKVAPLGGTGALPSPSLLSPTNVAADLTLKKTNFGLPILYKIGEINNYRKLVSKHIQNGSKLGVYKRQSDMMIEVQNGGKTSSPRLSNMNQTMVKDFSNSKSRIIPKQMTTHQPIIGSTLDQANTYMQVQHQRQQAYAQAQYAQHQAQLQQFQQNSIVKENPMPQHTPHSLTRVYKKNIQPVPESAGAELTKTQKPALNSIYIHGFPQDRNNQSEMSRYALHSRVLIYIFQNASLTLQID